MRRLFITGLVSAATMIALFGCDRKANDITEYQGVDISIQPYAQGRELLCIADNREEAEETARLYGIELVEYNAGIAIFHTEEDPYSIVDMGIKKGYKRLDVNKVNSL